MHECGVTWCIPWWVAAGSMGGFMLLTVGKLNMLTKASWATTPSSQCWRINLQGFCVSFMIFGCWASVIRLYPLTEASLMCIEPLITIRYISWFSVPNYVRDLIKVGVNVTVSRNKRNLKRLTSQYAQRAGLGRLARKLLQCVIFRAAWSHLYFSNNDAKVQSGRNHWFCHADMVYCRRFSSFAENSIHFSFVSSWFGLESIVTFLPLNLFALTHSPWSSCSKDIWRFWPDLISRPLFKKRPWSSAFDLEISRIS